MSLLYAITGRWDRVLFFLQGHVPLLQLRFKDQSLVGETSRLKAIVQEFPQTRIIINDDPDIAASCGAWGVHLGQEDLAGYRVEDLMGLPCHLGISTHNWTEIEHAQSFSPAYLGFGPIFPTSTKQVKALPQTVSQLAQVVSQCKLPIVAIGGIQPSNWQAVIEVNPFAIAMISALETVQDLSELRQWQTQLES